MNKVKVNGGYSLIELLIVITIFAFLGILVSQSLAMSIRGSKKSEVLTKIRSSLVQASEIMERQLRNANQINKSDADSYCLENKRVDYTDGEGNPAFFACQTENSEIKIASGSADVFVFLTGSDISLSSCEITCTPGEEGIPDSVEIKLAAQDPAMAGFQGAQVTIQSKILLRNY